MNDKGERRSDINSENYCGALVHFLQHESSRKNSRECCKNSNNLELFIITSTRVDTTSCSIQVVVVTGSMCSKNRYNTCILQYNTHAINHSQPTQDHKHIPYSEP